MEGLAMDATDAREPIALPVPVVDPGLRRCRLQFSGAGGEYFQIWIVNLLLTIATLGIYSAWAKVRKLQYFYRNTQLDGSVFDYHGNPVAILKGRILAVLMFVLYKMALVQFGAFALVVLLGLMAVVPWLLTQSYRFRLHNSSYRGLRFGFSGPVWQAYLIFGLPMVMVLAPGAMAALGLGGDPKHPDLRLLIGIGLAYVALMLLWPYLHFCFKRWQHGHASYGAARARFEAPVWDFYVPYVLASVMMFVVVLVGGVLISGFSFAAAPGHGQSRGVGAAAIATVIIFYGAMLAAAPLVSAWIQNAVWSNTRLEAVGFASDVRAGRLIGITLGNLAMVLVSLGLLIPFAVMRLMKYKIESIEVLDADAVARIAGDGQGAEVGTAGEGAMDVLDLDFGL